MTDLKTIAWIGDSYAIQGTITNPFTEALKATYGDGGVGWIDLYYVSSINPGVVIGGAGNWVSQRNTATSTGVNVSDVQTSDVSTPARITISVASQSATLYYLGQPGGGTFKWWVDKGNPVVIATESGTLGIKTSTIVGLNNAEHLFQIQILSAGTAGITLEGVDARTDPGGVVVHNLGSAGSTTQCWISVDATLWETSLADLRPTLVVIMLTPNDQDASISAEQQAHNIQELVSRIRSATSSSIPIVLAPPPDNGLNRLPAMSDYNSSQKALASSLQIGYIDVFDAIGPFNPLNFNSDLLHPNDYGGNQIALDVLNGLSQMMQ